MMLSLKNLSATYSKAPIVAGINAEVKAGEFIGLVGANGAGKSCLLKTIAGLLRPCAGQADFDGVNIHTLPIKTRARRIAYLGQDRSSVWPLPVSDLVALGRAPYRGGLGRLSVLDEAAIDAALSAAQCADLQDRRFDRLSGGEQMRVHLARALAVDAPLLLADEPIAALDPYFQISILGALQAQAKSGKTSIASLHDLSLARQYCTRIWVLHNGHLVQDEVPETALSADILAQVFRVKTQDGTVSLA